MIEIRPARGEAERSAALDLRERVFCGEQGVSFAGDQDGLDGAALHLVAMDGPAVVGTCRLLLDGGEAHFQRLCVAPEARRRGLGARLLGEAERTAAAAGARRMHLHAQLGALRLYERAGYTPVGAPFDDEGIPHLAMERDLA